MGWSSSLALFPPTVSPGLVHSTNLLNASSPDMNVDGSSTPVAFTYTAPAGGTNLFRLFLYIQDATAFQEDTFGALTALTNGVVITAAGETLATWKTNVDFVLTFHDFPDYDSLGQAGKSAAGRWTFQRAFGAALRLEAAETFVATVNDNLLGLTHLRMSVQGCNSQ